MESRDQHFFVGADKGIKGDLQTASQQINDTKTLPI